MPEDPLDDPTMIDDFAACGIERVEDLRVARGHDVRILDAEPRLLGEDDLVREILAERPDVLGITSTTPEIPLVRQLISGLKAADPSVITILGGAHVTAVPEEALEELGLPAVIRPEFTA